MTSLDGYLDSVCGQLRVNPAEAEDIRKEFRSHLEESIQAHVAHGMDTPGAVAAALSGFGPAGTVCDCLARVHQGDPWWLLRLKGLGLGLVIGAVLGAFIPLGGHLEFAVRALPLPADVDVSLAHVVTNAMLAGGVIGMLSAGGRGLLTGWCTGSVLWLAEYVVHWIASVASGTTGGTGVDMLNLVLLAPLLGGLFGAAVGAGTSAVLSATSRIRPQIQ